MKAISAGNKLESLEVVYEVPSENIGSKEAEKL